MKIFISKIIFLVVITLSWATLHCHGEELDEATINRLNREVDRKILSADFQWFVREKPVIRDERGNILEKKAENCRSEKADINKK